MSLRRTVPDVIDEHVTLELEALDPLCLNFLNYSSHRRFGTSFASTAMSSSNCSWRALLFRPTLVFSLPSSACLRNEIVPC